MPRPRRSSWQPESRRHRPCWPWTPVRWSSPLPSPSACPQVDPPSPYKQGASRGSPWGPEQGRVYTCAVQSAGQPQPQKLLACQETTQNRSKEQVKAGREQEVLWREMRGCGGPWGACSKDTSSSEAEGHWACLGPQEGHPRGWLDGTRGWEHRGPRGRAKDPGQASGRGVMPLTQVEHPSKLGPGRHGGSGRALGQMAELTQVWGWPAAV